VPGLVMVWSDTCRQSAGRASAQQAAPAQHAGGDVAEVRVVRGNGSGTTTLARAADRERPRT
jgi:hypothetical protein